MSDRSHIDAMDHQAACFRSNAAETEYDRQLRMNSAFFLYRPRLFPDGDQWCALLGDDLVIGIAGFGKSPAEAEAAFNAAWKEKRP